jgi:hypothetical protein
VVVEEERHTRIKEGKDSVASRKERWVRREKRVYKEVYNTGRHDK